MKVAWSVGPPGRQSRAHKRERPIRIPCSGRASLQGAGAGCTQNLQAWVGYGMRRSVSGGQQASSGTAGDG